MILFYYYDDCAYFCLNEQGILRLTTDLFLILNNNSVGQSMQSYGCWYFNKHSQKIHIIIY